MLPDGVLLFEAQSGFALTAAEGGEGSCSAGYVHVFCREEYGRPGQQTVRNIRIFRFIVFTSVMFRCRAFLHPGPTPRSVGFAGPGGAFGIGSVSVCLDREVVNLAGILWYIKPQQFRHLFIVLFPDGVDNDVPVLRQILP